MTVTIGGRATSQQRRESVSRRMTLLSSVLDAFDAQLAAVPPGTTSATDADTARRVVRALLPLALEDAAFDVTLTPGSSGVAVRVRHCPEQGAVAQVVAAAPDRRPAPHPAPARPTDPGVAAELADLLRHRSVRSR